MPQKRFIGISAALAIAYAVAVALVPPLGEFPINDDWDYAATAARVVASGRLQLTDWPAMPLVAHAMWGAIFIKLFGPSYCVLRVATMTTAVCGALALVCWYCRHGRSTWESLYIGVAWVFAPLVFVHSYTFMTDVTGVSLMVVWLALLPSTLSRPSQPRLLALGTLGGVCYLVRQPAAVPAAVLILLAFVDCCRRRLSVARLLAVSLPLGSIVAGHQMWLHAWHGVPDNLASSVFFGSHLADGQAFVNRIANLVLGFGLVSAPLVFVGCHRHGSFEHESNRCAKHVAAVVSFGLFGALLVGLVDSARPFGGAAVVFDFGLDPDNSLPGRESLRGPRLWIGAWSGSVFHAGAMILAVGGLLGWLRVAWHSLNAIRRQGTPRFECNPRTVVLCSWLVSAALLAVIEHLHERYLLPVAALAAAALVYRPPSMRPPVWAWALLLLQTAYSLSGVDDCLARHRAVWQAIDWLHQQRIPAGDINGGIAYAGTYRFLPQYEQMDLPGPYLRSLPPAIRDVHIALFSPHSFWVSTRPYALALTTLAGYDVVSSVEYQSWIRSGTVYILHRRFDEASSHRARDLPTTQSGGGTFEAVAGPEPNPGDAAGERLRGSRY